MRLGLGAALDPRNGCTQGADLGVSQSATGTKRRGGSNLCSRPIHKSCRRIWSPRLRLLGRPCSGSPTHLAFREARALTHRSHLLLQRLIVLPPFGASLTNARRTAEVRAGGGVFAPAANDLVVRILGTAIVVCHGRSGDADGCRRNNYRNTHVDALPQ